MVGSTPVPTNTLPYFYVSLNICLKCTPPKKKTSSTHSKQLYLYTDYSTAGLLQFLFQCTLFKVLSVIWNDIQGFFRGFQETPPL